MKRYRETNEAQLQDEVSSEFFQNMGLELPTAVDYRYNRDFRGELEINFLDDYGYKPSLSNYTKNVTVRSVDLLPEGKPRFGGNDDMYLLATWSPELEVVESHYDAITKGNDSGMTFRVGEKVQTLCTGDCSSKFLSPHAQIETGIFVSDRMSASDRRKVESALTSGCLQMGELKYFVAMWTARTAVAGVEALPIWLLYRMPHENGCLQQRKQLMFSGVLCKISKKTLQRMANEVVISQSPRIRPCHYFKMSNEELQFFIENLKGRIPQHWYNAYEQLLL